MRDVKAYVWSAGPSWERPPGPVGWRSWCVACRGPSSKCSTPGRTGSRSGEPSGGASRRPCAADVCANRPRH